MDKFTVFDVAYWFLAKSGMTHKKLQKLCYYAYSWVLALYNDDKNNIQHRLFDEEIEAWIHGPMCVKLYQHTKIHGWIYLDKLENYKSIFPKDIEDILENVWEVYKEFNSLEIEAMSVSEEPWKRARAGYGHKDIIYKTLDDVVIFEYFNTLYQSAGGDIRAVR